MSTFAKPLGAVTAGFKPDFLKSAAVVVAGSFATSFISGKITSMVGALGSNKFAKVATTLLTAGLVGLAAKKVMPRMAHELFAGGVISGVTEGLAEVFPSVKQIGMQGYDYGDELGINWQLGGMRDFADPRQVQYAVPARQPIAGMRDFADPRQVQMAVPARQPIAGMGDFVSVPQMNHIFPARQNISGLGWDEQMAGAEGEIEMSM